MSNVYLDNNRIMKMRDVDRELNKIGTWREYEKEIVIGALMVLLGSAALCAVIKRFQKNNMYIEIEAKKTKQNKQTNNTTYFYLEKQGKQR